METRGKKQKGFKKWFFIFKETATSWLNADPFRQSAVIAYYAIFSFPALLTIAIAIAAFVFGKETVNEKVTTDIASTMGADTAGQVRTMIEKTGEIKNSVIAAIIGIITLVVGASGVFEQLQQSLNAIWNIKVKPKQPFWTQVRTRLLSFGLVVSIGFLLLISLIITSVLAAFQDWMKSSLPDIAVYLIDGVNIIISFFIISFLFSIMFKVLPDAKSDWKTVWRGGMVTALLFMLGKYALAIYFGKAEPESAYGAAGSIILIMLWVYYSSMIVFFGAEFTQKYAKASGREIEPASNAEELN